MECRSRVWFTLRGGEVTSFSVFFLQAYINTKRLSVTEINTLVPQVFESPAAATATCRTCPEKMEMGPSLRRLKITSCKWGV